MINIINDVICGKRKIGESMTPKGIHHSIVPWEYHPENPFSPIWNYEMIDNNNAKEKNIFLIPDKEKR